MEKQVHPRGTAVVSSLRQLKTAYQNGAQIRECLDLLVEAPVCVLDCSSYIQTAGDMPTVLEFVVAIQRKDVDITCALEAFEFVPHCAGS